MELNTEVLIRRLGSEEQVVSFLLSEIRKGHFGFPYYSTHFRQDTEEEMFEKLKVSVISRCKMPMRIGGYSPKNGLYIQPISWVITPTEEQIDHLDILPDLRFEDVRLRESPSTLSALDAWHHPTICAKVIQRAIRFPIISSQSLRISLGLEINEERLFSVTYAKGLLEIVSETLGQEFAVVDPQMGYGEFFYAAMALQLPYVGFNLDERKQSGFQSARAFLAGELIDQVDVRLGSWNEVEAPPGFPVRLSRADFIPMIFPRFPGESINRRSADYFQEIIQQLHVAWSYLQVDGYLAFYLIDHPRFPLACAVNLWIDQFLSGSQAAGPVLLRVDYKKSYPIWLWRKQPDRVKVAPRSFFTTFPELSQRVVFSQLHAMAPELQSECLHQKRQLSQLLQGVLMIYPHLNRKTILSLVGETALLAIIKRYTAEEALRKTLELVAPWAPQIKASSPKSSVSDDDEMD